MAFDPLAYDSTAYEVIQPVVRVYTSDPAYWVPEKCLVEIYDNTGNTLLLSYDSFDPESNAVKLLDCMVSLGLTNTQFKLRFEDGNNVIDQNMIGLGNKVLVYAGRQSNDLTLLFTGYSEDRTPIILGSNVLDYEMRGYGENASLNDVIVNFKRASSSLTDIDDPNFPKRPDSKMVVHELVRDLFEDADVRVTKDIILKNYFNLDISGISPLVTERLLSIVQKMQEVSAVLNFLSEVTGAYWKIENGKLFFEYPEIQHSGIVLKNVTHPTDLASTTSYFIEQWRYTDSISKDNGFANRIYTTTATDTKSIASSMSNQGATSLFDRAIAVQVTLLETRINTLAFVLSRIGDPFTTVPDEELIESRGGQPNNPPPPPPTCPTGYHLDPVTNQCVADGTNEPPQCPTGYHWDTDTEQCVADDPGGGGGGEGQIDSYGIKWLVANGEQFVVEMSRDESTDDRWSGNVTGLRQGAEATFIGRSKGTGSGAHFAMKCGGGNHSGSGAGDQRWYDLGIRENGDVQLEWEGPHPDNHDFSLPSSKQFITNIGKGLENNWIGLKWCIQTVSPNSTPANGGVRVRMWVDTDPIGTDNKPRNNWQLCFDFIDGVDAEVIDPQDYEMPDEWDCEVRRSDTDNHDIFGLGQIITDCGEGDPGLHVRRLGTGIASRSVAPAAVGSIKARYVPDTGDDFVECGQLDFNIAGNFGSGGDATATAKNLLSNSPDLIFMTGNYANDDIIQIVENSKTPIFGLVGYKDDPDIIEKYLDVFQNKHSAWTETKNGITFIGCSYNEQDDIDFIDRRCKEAFRDKNIHTIIILTHHSIARHHQRFLEYRPKLKMVISSEANKYERLLPVDNILYVINGMGGESPSSGENTPSVYHKINGTLHCRLNTDGSITCDCVPNSGEAPQIMDTFTIHRDGTMPIDGVLMRDFPGKQETERKRPPRMSDPNKVLPHVKCDPETASKDKKRVRQVALQQAYEQSGYSVENKIRQSAPVTSELQEQVVKGELRLDNDNTPNGPVVAQFKVPVGGLSSTADTIFVNDVKVDPAVLSPTGKYWIVLLPCGNNYRNTILWHHDGIMSTFGKYSAFAKGLTKAELSDWKVSDYGPTYTHAVFAKLRRIQEYSDPQSIQRFRLKEDMAEADFLDDSLSVAKMMQNILAVRGKPVRKYEINDVTLPLDTWFTPGQNITIVDSTGHHEESKNIFAEIQEVQYSWSTESPESTLGLFRVRILPVGHLNWHREMMPPGD